MGWPAELFAILEDLFAAKSAVDAVRIGLVQRGIDVAPPFEEVVLALADEVQGAAVSERTKRSEDLEAAYRAATSREQKQKAELEELRRRLSEVEAELEATRKPKRSRKTP